MKKFAAGMVSGALLIGLIVGVAGVAAGAPYVYGCVPGQSHGGENIAVLYVYNGSLTTANVTAKWLSRDGVNRTATVSGAVGSFSVVGGATKVIKFTEPAITGYSWESPVNDDNSIDAIRIVSNVPIIAGMNHFGGGSNFSECQFLQQG